MTVRSTIIASSALLALAACGRGNHNDAANSTAATGADSMNAAGPMAAPTNSNASQTFANAAAASDAFEIETSKLALANGSSASIKSYAQKMIDAHTASTAKLKTAAAAATPAITPDPALNAEQQHKLDELKKLNGPAFDQAYATEQAAGHQQTLDTLRGYAGTGDVPQLKSFATGMVPIVAAHLNMAKGLKA